MAGGFRRWLGRLAHPDDGELEAAEPQTGIRPIAECSDRDLVRVRATIEGLSVRPRATTPWLEARISDGTGTLTLVWMGRQEIPGIEPGHRLIAEGRICAGSGGCCIYNPLYTLLS